MSGLSLTAIEPLVLFPLEVHLQEDISAFHVDVDRLPSP
jgi:hypothetical protein